MALPGNVTLITVNGTYVDYQGNPIAGSIRFSSSQTLRDMAADVIIIQSTSVATLDPTGSFSIVLPATNDPDLSDIFTYLVEESFLGGRSYSISLTGGSPVEMADIAPPYVVSPTYYSFVSSTDWAILDATVQDMDTKVDQANLRFIGPLGFIYSTDLPPYVTQAQTQQTNAESSLTSAQVDLASIISENASRLDDFMIMGA